MTVFLDIDNELRLLELMRELFGLTFQLCNTADVRIRFLRSRSSLLGNEALGNLTSPQGEVRCIESFTTQEGSDLARLGTTLRLLEDPELIRRGKLPAYYLLWNLGIRDCSGVCHHCILLFHDHFLLPALRV
jgi:hypothetical protein